MPRDPTMPAWAGNGGCPDETTIIDFVQGRCPLGRRPEIERHIGDCEECRCLVSALAASPTLVPPHADDNAPEGGGALARDNASGGRPIEDAPGGVPVRPGDVIDGKYRIERLLGEGGMGVVFAAVHLRIDTAVALKFLSRSAHRGASAMRRVEHEARAAGKLESEHAARVFDVGALADGTPFIVMELLTGVDLAVVMRVKGPLPIEDAIEYVLQACRGLAVAHERGIVHRDLKPGNLFLSQRTDGSPLVKLLDFGIAKLVPVEGSVAKLGATTAGSAVGSPLYMSPEQLRNSRDVDARTDIWSLGCVLYELLTGRPVFMAETLEALCVMIATAPTPLLRAYRPLAPQGLEDVVARCLEKDPARRYQRVTELAHALATHARSGAPASAPYHAAARAPRWRRPMIAASFVVLAVVALVLRSGELQPRAAALAHEAPPRALAPSPTSLAGAASEAMATPLPGAAAEATATSRGEFAAPSHTLAPVVTRKAPRSATPSAPEPTRESSSPAEVPRIHPPRELDEDGYSDRK